MYYLNYIIFNVPLSKKTVEGITTRKDEFIRGYIQLHPELGSLKEFADLVEMPRNKVYGFMKGIGLPSTTDLRVMYDRCDANVDYIVTGIMKTPHTVLQRIEEMQEELMKLKKQISVK